MKKFFYILTINLLILFSHVELYGQTNFNLKASFDQPNSNYEKIGRGLCKIEDGILKTKEAYASFGDQSWTNYEVNFSARTPISEKEVWIWAGFRASDRDDRYILGLRGGAENDLSLARLGYMGADEFLSIEHLDFKLQPGKWYGIKIQVSGNRIRIFLNNEQLPRIDITDKNNKFAQNGKVILGGSWVRTDFDNLSIKPLNADEWSGQPVNTYTAQSINKEGKRKKERALYQPIKVKAIGHSTEVSLNGKWLFIPDYEIHDTDDAILPSKSDQSWHVVTVPHFWNVLQVWVQHSGKDVVSDSYYQKEVARCEAYTFDYKKTEIGWYRQWIDLPENIKEKHLELSFDAVSKIAEVWVNGKKAGSHIGMFGEFKINATGLLKPGKNLLVVKVIKDYIKDKDIKDGDKIASIAVTMGITQKMLKDLPHGIYVGDPAGIWQPVALTITDPVKIEDVFIKPNLNGAHIDVTLKNYSEKQREISLSTDIESAKSKVRLFRGLSVKQVQLRPGEEKKVSYSIGNLKPDLWSPATPNLYNFSFIINSSDNAEVDRKSITSGFRTFEVRGDYFYLNNIKYWLRGANHAPMSLAPNDTLLANVFTKLMHDANIAVTRTHASPFNKVWMDAADKNGVGVSYEGSWPWLMIGDSPIPDSNLLTLWRDEWYDLIKKYRNDPSLLFWTINNEMDFYNSDPNFERAKLKMRIISAVVKKMRELDPTRPICFDSGFLLDEKKFGKNFLDSLDVGDIDDRHWYPNWYQSSVFSEFNGEFQKFFRRNTGRPFISQEMSTGYISGTGHPVRSYTFVNQTPQTLIGNYSYDFANPDYFLTTQAFITKEVAEALRRSNDKVAGILHFSLFTWFSDIYLHDKITPFPVYYGIKKALQPVLVSAELWGRNFYAGSTLPIRIYVVNDGEDGSDLPETELRWSLVSNKGITLASGKALFPEVPYSGRKWIEPIITIPQNLPVQKLGVKLVLQLLKKGKVISGNETGLLLVTKDWIKPSSHLADKKIIVVDVSKKIQPVLDFQNIRYRSFNTVKEAVSQKADIYILAGLDSANTSQDEVIQIRELVSKGGNVLLLNSGKLSATLYPEYIRGLISINPSKIYSSYEPAEIISMEIPESDVFDGIEPLELRYFNNNKRENPAVISAAYQINRDSEVEPLASFLKFHGYLKGDNDARKAQLEKIKGYPIVKINDKGHIILSEVLLEKGNTDPVAGKLLINMIDDLLRNKKTEK